MAEERYLIGPGLRDKLREVITRVDGVVPYGGSGPEPRIQSLSQPLITFRVGTATGAWSKATSKTVSLRADTNLTVTATNLFASVGKTASYNVAIARDGTAWYLIAAEC